MYKEGRVSVLIAVHNGEASVADAIRSVLNQTYQEVEAVVVDDGSTDSSWEIIQDLAHSDKRVVASRLPFASGGPAVPRNVAIDSSSGSHLALLDQDDCWLPDKIASQLELFEEDNVGLVFSNCETGGGVPYHEREWRFSSTNTLAEIIRQNPVPACTAVWPRQVADLVGVFDPKLASVDDRDYWLRIALEGFEFRYAPDLLARLNTQGARLSNDRVQHDELSVEMWNGYVAKYPEHEALKGALRRAKRARAKSFARSSRELPLWRRPFRLVAGWKLDPSFATLDAIIRDTRVHQKIVLLRDQIARERFRRQG